MPDLPELLTIPETAELLRVSERTVYRYIDDGTLDAVKISHGVLRIRRASVERLLDGEAS